MRNFDPATLTALGQRAASMRFFIRFDLPEGTFGFWSGIEPYVFEGVNYVGSGQLITIDEVNGAIDPSVQPLTVRLTSIPNSALTPDVLGSIFSYAWHQAPATLHQGYFNPQTGATIMIERITRRRIDTIEMVEAVGGSAQLVATLQPINFDNPGRGFMLYGDGDQRLIDSNDGFFSFAATAGEQTINWGRLPDATTTQGVGAPGSQAR